MGIATTDFPGALDSKDSLVWAANNASTTLATTINDTDTSIVLTSAAAFPASGIIRIDDELIAYSSKATNTLTVQASPTGRGFESTTAASHTSGATVRLIISAASHNVQSDAIIATQTKIGTGASTPAANVVLTGTGTGTSAWATISNAFIASNAAIDLTKLATVTASRALVSSAGGVISASSVTATELGYVSGVTSAIQTQFSGKVSTGLITASGLTVNSLSRLLGRGTALGSDIQEISLDASLAFSGTILTAVPAGSTGQVQYNDSGFYGASPRFTFVTNGLSSDVLITTPEDTTNSRLILQRARSGPAAVTSGNVLGELLFQGYNASYLDGASIQATTTANWASSRSAKFLFSVRNGGTAFIYDLQFDRFLPPSDNSASLGISGTAWSTLHTRSITLAGSTSGTTVLQAAATAAGTYTWPGSDGTSGQVLSTNGSGVLSWASVTASAAGADTQLQRNNGGALGAVTGATSDGTNVTFGSGNLIATSPSITTSLTTGSTSFDLINTTATTVNFAGAATTLNMAGGSGAVINLGGGANAAELRFLEPSGSGTNYTALKAQAQAANVTYTLPAADGTSGQVLSTNGSGTLSWATASGGGGGTPGGSSGQVQYNDSSAFNGSALFTFSPTVSPNVVITANAAGSTALRVVAASSPTTSIFQVTGNVTTTVHFAVTSSGAPTAPGATNSERFGAGSVVSSGSTGQGNTAIGANAACSTTNDDNTMVGAGSGSSGNNNSCTGVGRFAAAGISNNTGITAVGASAGRFCRGEGGTFIGIYAGQGFNSGNPVTGGSNTAIGNRAGYSLTSGTNNVYLGHRSGDPSNASFLVTGSNNTALGYFTNTSTGCVTLSSTIAIGANASATASNQCVIGGANADGQINDMYVGSGVTFTAPVNVTINASGGSGTNIVGADLSLAGGRGTGSAAGGVVNIRTAPTGSSGTALNALVTALRVDASTTATHTRLLVFDVDTGLLSRVTVGAADSGGTGFKVLRIPN